MGEPFDVGSVITRAALLKRESEDSLTPEQLREAAGELGVEPAVVDAAVIDLTRRRVAQAQARKARARARARVAVAASLVVIAALTLAGLAMSSARVAWAQLEQQRVAVVQARARHSEVQALWGARAGAPDADAELNSAVNRVQLAQRSYDNAASSWNARGFVHDLGASLAGLPDTVPLSADRTAW